MLKRGVRFVGILVVSVLFATVIIAIVEMTGMNLVRLAD